MSLINYDRPVTDLRAGLNATGHITHANDRKTMVTLHHNGGGPRFSFQDILNIWKTRPASAHFDVDADGDVCQYANVNDYAWACASTVGNRTSISIEMANSGLAPSWQVSETTWKSAARLAGWLFANVIGTRPTSSTLVYHHHWFATACAGPYMDSVYGRVLAEAQAAYDAFKGGHHPNPVTPPAPATPTYYIGANVQRAWAKTLGTTADGEISSQDSGQKGCFDVVLWPCIQWAPAGTAKGSRLIAAFQRKHGLKDDGIIGPKTMRAIQAWAGLTGKQVDGVGGPITTKAICRKLGFK